MRCVQYREALSAELDGEPLGVTAGVLAEHVRACPACASWRDSATRVTRLARVVPVDRVPDLTDRILGSVGIAAGGPSRSASRRRTGIMLRVALAAVGLSQAAVGWPAVALGVDTMQPPMHVAHETGAWNVALAVAFLAVARRRRYATGLLP